MKHISHDLYQALQQHKEKLTKLSLKRLFKEDNERSFKFSLEAGSLYFDYSKNHITSESMELFNRLTEEVALSPAIKALFNGEAVNNTEHRAALHTTLRAQGQPCSKNETVVAETLGKISLIVNQLHNSEWLGFSGKPITTVINIGIGGSDLGPRMVTRALHAYQKNIRVEFVANIDGADLSDTLTTSDPETTLFIIASKSFSTLETLENANSAKQWMLSNECPESKLTRHFVAISTNIKAVEDFGISPDNTLPLWDWVGGRYSLWSAIGLPIAISIGMTSFRQLLAGAYDMDQHYINTDTEHNMPVIAGLLSFWYSQFWGSISHAILPYAQRLKFLPGFLQQLDMESLGKSVTKHGQPVEYSTGNIIWGTEGTNGQHSFYQLLHQGTHIIPVDFVVVKDPMSELTDQHRYLQACCISQSQALLQGKTLIDAERELREKGISEAQIKTLAPHKVITGNKPSNTLIMDQLCPKTLGSLIAFYEHKVYTLGVLLNINPFDQWGVELGKQLGTPVYQALNSEQSSNQWDSSTRSLIDRLRFD
jgi:glucose-6-phosphate isomerase